MSYKKITSYETACKALGIKPLSDEVFNALPKAERENVKAYHKLTVITRAINEGWYPDFSNRREDKYEPYMYINSAGLAAAASGSAPSYTIAGVGSRLCFSDYERATYAVTTFKDLYQAYFFPPKWEDEQEAEKKATAEKEPDNKEQAGGADVKIDDLSNAPVFLQKIGKITTEQIQPLHEQDIKNRAIIMITAEDNAINEDGEKGFAVTFSVMGIQKTLEKALYQFIKADKTQEIIKGAKRRLEFDRLKDRFDDIVKDFINNLK